MSDTNSTCPTIATIQQAFLTILPRIELHGRVSFRHLPPGPRKDDALAEMTALSWQWFLRLAQRGKDATQFPGALARFAARAVHSGRRLCGHEPAKDALSPRAQFLKGFQVSTLPDSSSLYGNVFDEALHDNHQTPVPDQVSFRLDFPVWLNSLGDRNRHIAVNMALGHHTAELAQRFGLSPARVSQLRRLFHEDWQRYHGETSESENRATAAA